MILKGHLAAWRRLQGPQVKTRSQFGRCWTHSERNSGGLDQGGNSGGGGKQKETGNTLKIASTRLARVKFGMWEERCQR